MYDMYGVVGMCGGRGVCIPWRVVSVFSCCVTSSVGVIPVQTDTSKHGTHGHSQTCSTQFKQTE